MWNELKEILKKNPKLYSGLREIYHKSRYKISESHNKMRKKDNNPEKVYEYIVPEDIKWKMGMVHRILIIGRTKIGDSIGTHTRAFLNAADYSAYDVFLFEEYTHELRLYKDEDTYELIKVCNAPDIDASFFDILIYLNVIDNCSDDYPFEDRVPRNKSFLSYVYPVFDGTIPPDKWVTSINRYFDAVITPCNNLKRIYEQNCVAKPVFELPISLDLRKYSQLSNLPHDRKEFVFGYIGSFEDRKNPMKIIEAFEKVFAQNKNVRLVMHSRTVDWSSEVGRQLKEFQKKEISNIEISLGVKNEDEIIKLMNSFDCYIIASIGEGYSITPRQALACGLPLVISEIPTHKDITKMGEQDGIFWVESKQEVDAVQVSLNGEICGKMFDCLVDDLSKAIKKVYDNKDSILSNKKIAKRMKEAMKYDDSRLKYIYKQIMLPVKVERANENVIKDDVLYTNDIDLYIKTTSYIKSEKREIIVCPAHDGGFCSIFNKWISHLVYSSDNTMLIPDWRVKTLKCNQSVEKGKQLFKSFCYGTEEDGNIFFKCFENPYSGWVNEEIFENDLMYTYAKDVISLDDFNAENEPFLTYINSRELYRRKKYFDEFRHKYNMYWKKYIRLNSKWEQEINLFYKEKINGRFLITAQIRSDAHSSELVLVDGKNASWDMYENHIRKVLSDNNINPESDNWRLFIASDNSMSIEHFEFVFPNHVISQNMERLGEQDDLEYKKAVSKEGKQIEGFGLQHRAASDANLWTIDKAKDILFDVFLLAKGDAFIYVMSNISTMVSYINPDMEMIYCE